MNDQTVDKRQLCAELKYIAVIMRQERQLFIVFCYTLFPLDYTFCKLGDDACKADSQDLSLVVCVLA